MPYICIRTKIAFQLRYFIELAYKGTNYHGWQLQPNAITVQEEINKALSTVLRISINVVGAGRTDSGVHAEQLFAHFNVENELNVMLTFTFSSEGEIVILNVDSKNQDVLDYLRKNLNYKKVKSPGERDKLYTMPLKMKTS